jgi:glycoside hydrolase-like protein
MGPGFDYSSRIAPASLRALGCSVVFRYVVPGYAKSLTAAEYAELRAAGITVILIYETSADFMLGGYHSGQRAAIAARSFATSLGAPATAMIFYSLDIGATPQQLDSALSFLDGAASVDPAGKAGVGAYGEYAFVKRAINDGYAGWGTVGWSGGQRDPRAIAWQTGQGTTIDGIPVDYNDLNPAAFTQGDPAVAPTIPPSIAAKFPNLVADFPPNSSFDTNTALIWADAGAREAAYNTAAILIRLDQITGAVDPNLLAAAVVTAIVPHLPPAIDAGVLAADVAAAIEPHIGAVDVQALADDIAHKFTIAP